VLYENPYDNLVQLLSLVTLFFWSQF